MRENEVNKMNRKVTLMVIAAIAAILPSVAIADVMISGSIGVNGTSNTAVFTYVPGTNFQAADGSVSWNAYHTANAYMGDLKFAKVSNQTTFIINVMEIQFQAGLAPGTFYLNSSIFSPFIVGSMMYLKLSPIAFSDFTYTGLPGATPSVVNPAVTAFQLQTDNTFSTPVSGGTTIYIGFFTPAYDGQAVTGEITLAGTYLSG